MAALQTHTQRVERVLLGYQVVNRRVCENVLWLRPGIVLNIEAFLLAGGW